MARWKPHDKVGLNEQIGRRLFDEPMLKGATVQPSFSGIKLTHFEEKRDDKTSLDRMGASNIDRQVRKYLIPRAEAAGLTFRERKQFDGWAVVSAKELIQSHKEPKLPVYSSPEEKPEPEDNIYHAHVARPPDLSVYQMALHLRHIFTTYGKIEKHTASKEPWRNRFWKHYIVAWVLAKIH